jgi:hypothetical protein
MLDALLHKIRMQLLAGRYVVTLHAEEEMDQDALSTFDVEKIVLTGRIVRRQPDRRPGEWKYLIRGRSITGEPAAVVVRLSPTATLVIITVYAE